MKVQVVVPMTICVSVVLLGIIRVRKTEQEKEDKRNRFQVTKLRVTYDVLREYQSDKLETQKLLDKTEIDKKTLEEQVNMLKAKADQATGVADDCQGRKKTAKDEAAKVESEFNNLKATTNNEIASLKREVETLTQKLAARSEVCEFVKQDSQAASKLCGKEGTPKKEEPKKEEAPKKEEPKAEAPKKEEPKAEAPKKEEPKAEAPKKEEPKAGAPKKT